VDAVVWTFPHISYSAKNDVIIQRRRHSFVAAPVQNSVFTALNSIDFSESPWQTDLLLWLLLNVEYKWTRKLIYIFVRTVERIRYKHVYGTVLFTRYPSNFRSDRVFAISFICLDVFIEYARVESFELWRFRTKRRISLVLIRFGTRAISGQSVSRRRTINTKRTPTYTFQK